MKVSEKKLNRNLEKQILRVFYQLIADIKDADEVEKFFQDFLNKASRLRLAKRLTIALLLEKGRSYQEIKKGLNVSSSTVADVYKDLGTSGMQLAIKKVKAEEWAEDWSKKIGGAFQRIFSQK